MNWPKFPGAGHQSNLNPEPIPFEFVENQPEQNSQPIPFTYQEPNQTPTNEATKNINLGEKIKSETIKSKYHHIVNQIRAGRGELIGFSFDGPIEDIIMEDLRNGLSETEIINHVYKLIDTHGKW